MLRNISRERNVQGCPHAFPQGAAVANTPNALEHFQHMRDSVARLAPKVPEPFQRVARRLIYIS
eukprot:2349195-Alexandrium_andersonii.AAC.1